MGKPGDAARTAKIAPAVRRSQMPVPVGLRGKSDLHSCCPEASH